MLTLYYLKRFYHLNMVNLPHFFLVDGTVKEEFGNIECDYQSKYTVSGTQYDFMRHGSS